MAGQEECTVPRTDAFTISLDLTVPLTSSGFSHNWEAFMGSTEDPVDGGAVATNCYIAALLYVGFIVFCGCQLGAHRRYSRIQI